MLFRALSFPSILVSSLLILFTACIPNQASERSTNRSIELETRHDNPPVDSAADDNAQDRTQEETDPVGKYLEILKSSDDVYEKGRAAAGLADHPEQFKRFAISLSELFLERDEVLNHTAKRIFHRLGKKAVDALQPNLDSDDLNHVRRVCSAISAVGDPCLNYAPELVDILRTEDDMFRRSAATFALTGFSKGYPDAIEAVLRDLDHRDMNVTLFAMRLIIKTGDESRQAIPKLLNLLENGVISQRGYAIWSLAAIGLTDEFDTVDEIGNMLEGFTVSERERALLAAGLLGSAAKEHAPRVTEIMNKNHTNIEGRAAVTLWKITGEPDDCIERLMELSKSSLAYELSGLELISEMGPDASPAIDLLIERTGASDESVRVAALDALRAIGSAAMEHKEHIAEIAANDKDPLVRLAAAEFLEALESSGD